MQHKPKKWINVLWKVLSETCKLWEHLYNGPAPSPGGNLYKKTRKHAFDLESDEEKKENKRKHALVQESDQKIDQGKKKFLI